MPRLTVSAAEHISNCSISVQENNHDNGKKNLAEKCIEMK